MILHDLLRSGDVLLGRINEAQLSRYDRLQTQLRSTDVMTNHEYRKTFIGYYRMGQHQPQWYEHFFSLLEREKHNATVTFPDVLAELYRTQGRLEASFSSKLIATIRPDKPIYDKFVRQNLSLVVPPLRLPPDTRIRKFLELYSLIEAKTNTLVQHASFQELKDAFDEKFPRYAHFTDIKKLDFLLWQYRQRPTLEVRQTIVCRRDAKAGSPDTRPACDTLTARKVPITRDQLCKALDRVEEATAELVHDRTFHHAVLTRLKQWQRPHDMKSLAEKIVSKAAKARLKGSGAGMNGITLDQRGKASLESLVLYYDALDTGLFDQSKVQLVRNKFAGHNGPKFRGPWP